MVYREKVVPQLVTLEHLRSLNRLLDSCVCSKYNATNFDDCKDIVDDDCKNCIFDGSRFEPELLVDYLLSHNIITKEELFGLRLEGILI